MVMGSVRVSGAARVALIAGVLAGLVCVQQPLCASCCPERGGAEKAVASNSCCGEDCGGSALDKGRGGSCLLAGGSSAGRYFFAVGLQPVFRVFPPAELCEPAASVSCSPPRSLASIALRL